MICSNCKKEVAKHKSICPHCKALIINEKEQQQNIKSFISNKENLVIKNKFVNNADAFSVGSAVTDDNGSKVLIKPKKKQKEVKRNKFVNYIDYQEAKGQEEFKAHRKEYEKQMKEQAKQMNAKIFSFEKVVGKATTEERLSRGRYI